MQRTKPAHLASAASSSASSSATCSSSSLSASNHPAPPTTRDPVTPSNHCQPHLQLLTTPKASSPSCASTPTSTADSLATTSSALITAAASLPPTPTSSLTAAPALVPSIALAHTPSPRMMTGGLATAGALGGPLDMPPIHHQPHHVPSVPIISHACKQPGYLRRLAISMQPASEFYKDEGGKANALCVGVSLVETIGRVTVKTPDNEFVNIPLRVTLYYESGKKVEDSDQDIFRFVGNEYDSIVIRAATRKALIHFRLEKVSRRKDGQRFKLRIEVDQEQCTANLSDINPIFTNAICVLSKRKHHPHHGGESAQRSKEPPSKLCRRGEALRDQEFVRDIARVEENIAKKIDAFTKQVDELTQTVHAQNQVLERMERMLRALSTPTDTFPLEWFLKSNEEPLARDTSGHPIMKTEGAGGAMHYFAGCDHEQVCDSSEEVVMTTSTISSVIASSANSSSSSSLSSSGSGSASSSGSASASGTASGSSEFSLELQVPPGLSFQEY